MLRHRNDKRYRKIYFLFRVIRNQQNVDTRDITSRFMTIKILLFSMYYL